MSRFWNWVSNLTPGETARSSEVDANFSGANGGFTNVEGELNRSLRVALSGNPGLAQGDLELADTAVQRAGKVLGFGNDGKPITLNAAFRYRGAWTTGAVYSTNDVVQTGIEKSLWLCIAAHTASALFSTDQATKWVLAVDLSELRKSIRTFQIVTSAQSPFAAAAGDDLMVDVSGGAVTINLPAGPVITDQPISIVHIAGPISSNNIIVARNGQNIMSLAENMAVTDTNAAFELAFSDTARGWRLVRGT